MNIYLKDQKKTFEVHLDTLKKKVISFYSANQLSEKVSIINICTSKALSELSFSFFFEYDIFPDNILTAYCQWRHEKRTMQNGDTILQQVFIPPFQHFSLKLIMGVRINNIIDESKKKGFSYETLKGHVEIGFSEFIIEEVDRGHIIFKIHTFSKPQNTLARFSSFVSIPYQQFCTTKALYKVKRQLEAQL